MVLNSRLRAPDWSADGDPEREAKCRKFPLPKNHDVTPDTDPFFYDEEEAAHICNGTYDDTLCPFRARCLYGALLNNEQNGTWGGLTTEQRRWVRRQRYTDKADDPNALINAGDWEAPYQHTWLARVPTPTELEERNSAPEEEE